MVFASFSLDKKLSDEIGVRSTVSCWKRTCPGLEFLCAGGMWHQLWHDVAGCRRMWEAILAAKLCETSGVTGGSREDVWRTAKQVVTTVLLENEPDMLFTDV